MVDFIQPKVAVTFISTYMLLAYVALDSLRNQSTEDLDKLLGNSTILLVVAHPDDETMFFGPTIMSIADRNTSLLILSMSNGDAENYGSKREQELADVIKALGPSVTLSIIKDPSLRDDMSVNWSVDKVSNFIKEQIITSRKPISTLITFDSYGISGHPNHRSIHSAVKELKHDLDVSNVRFYVLTSLTLLRKYTSYLDSVATFVSNYINKITKKRELTIAISFNEYAKLKRILQLHHSQMVWYRQLYMMFSRYMFINNLEFLD